MKQNKKQTSNTGKIGMPLATLDSWGEVEDYTEKEKEEILKSKKERGIIKQEKTKELEEFKEFTDKELEEFCETETNLSDGDAGNWKKWYKEIKAKKKAKEIQKSKKEFREEIKEKEERARKLTPITVKVKVKKTSTDNSDNISPIAKIKKKMRVLSSKKRFPRVEKAKEEQKAIALEEEGQEFFVGLGLDQLLETGPERIVLRKIIEKLPKKLSYLKEQCYHTDEETGIRCRRIAVGNGQLCEKHGGRRHTEEGLSTVSSIIHTLIKKKSKYNPIVHPLDYIKLSQRGFSPVEIAAEFTISMETLRKWVEIYNDFGDAYEIGAALYESWWLKKGKSGLEDTRNFNTPLYKFLTSNKLGYSDKMETKNTNNNNNNFGVLVVPGTVSLSEWEKGGSSASIAVNTEEQKTLPPEILEIPVDRETQDIPKLEKKQDLDAWEKGEIQDAEYREIPE